MASDLLPCVFANFGCFPKNSFGSGWMDAMKMLKCFELFFNTRGSVVARLFVGGCKGVAMSG